MQLTSINKLIRDDASGWQSSAWSRQPANGSAVHRAGDALGTIDRLLIDKVSGKITMLSSRSPPD